MTIDKSIRKTQDAIVEALNQSGLSLCTMEILLENILNVVHKKAEQALLAEPEERSINNGTDESDIH